jgi:hypothetical protein
MDCKSAHPGSIPGVASIISPNPPPAKNFKSAHLGLARLCGHVRRIALPVAVPPHCELTPSAAHDWDIDREHKQPEWDHPEAEHGQEAEQSTGDKQDAEPDADRLGPRQMPVAVEDADFVGHAGAERYRGRAGHRDFSPQPQSPLARRARSCGAHAACSSGKAAALLLFKVWRRLAMKRALLPGSSVGRASGC